jgi:chromosome segregation ATPase
MWVSSIVINNMKSFADSGVINLDKRMNVLIGPNNAGKSVIIQALYLLQNPSMLVRAFPNSETLPCMS